LSAAACDGRGAGAAVIQWFTCSSAPAVPPRLGAHDSVSAVPANAYGVSWSTSNAGSSHGTPGRPDSSSTTTRSSRAMSARSVGHGAPGAPR
jgi:hypothetical protein